MIARQLGATDAATPAVPATTALSAYKRLLPGTDAAGAVCVAEQIREAVSGIRIRRAQSEQTIASVTVSVGVAQRAPGESFDGWFERADKALYKAKNNGRNRVEKAS